MPRTEPPGYPVLLGCLCSSGEVLKSKARQDRGQSVQLRCRSLCLCLLQPGPLPGCLFPFGSSPRLRSFRGHIPAFWTPGILHPGSPFLAVPNKQTHKPLLV